MERNLERARIHFGGDTRGLLEGGRYALLHTRSLELDDLRPYVPGDDVRDIDWRATAREGDVLVKRFVTEKHHKILLVADAGRNMAALTPTGERKSDVAALVIGVVGLVAMDRSDEVALVYGDRTGSGRTPARRGETHLGGLVDRYRGVAAASREPSDIAVQLDYVAAGFKRRMVLVVISDEPEPGSELGARLRGLAGRHDVLWAMVEDQPAIGSADDELDGFDVGTGRLVLGGPFVGPRVVAAYRRAEAERRARLDAFLTECGVRGVRIAGAADLRRGMVSLLGDFAHAR
ncbi:DUF58 domain-containing protein [Tsukamurella soli]|uniref:DUF58 domain-containing protein n=1 Tax=Tsukamurella soli TaxID=644556 RepID=A0ABP8JUC9_9ACTN